MPRGIRYNLSLTHLLHGIDNDKNVKCAKITMLTPGKQEVQENLTYAPFHYAVLPPSSICRLSFPSLCSSAFFVPSGAVVAACSRAPASVGCAFAPDFSVTVVVGAFAGSL